MVKADLDTWKQLLATPTPPALGPQRRAGTRSEFDLVSALEPLPSRRLLPARRGELIRALLLLWHDHLEAAHRLAQASETADGNFIHAILHRREPDASNSRYWWRRVGNHPCFPEMARRVDELLRSREAGELAGQLLPNGSWNADAFVDACVTASRLSETDATVTLLREIQRVETEVLLEHLLGIAK